MNIDLIIKLALALANSDSLPIILNIFRDHGVTDEQFAKAVANNANKDLVKDAVIKAGGTWPE